MGTCSGVPLKESKASAERMHQYERRRCSHVVSVHVYVCVCVCVCTSSEGDMSASRASSAANSNCLIALNIAQWSGVQGQRDTGTLKKRR